MNKIKLFLWTMVILFILNTLQVSGYNYYKIELPEIIQKYLYDECQYYEIEYELALAVIKLETELTFDMNFVSNNIKNEIITSVDSGLFQINSNYENWYAELAGIKDNYDVIDPYCNIVMGLSGLIYWRDYVTEKEKLIDQDKIIIYMLECYTHGYCGHQKYIKKYGEYQSAYSKVILDYYKEFKDGDYNVTERRTISGITY
jgi:hypothetical protein